jgi:hypothetical protein
MRLSRTITILIAVLLSSMTVAAQSDPIFAGVWSQKEGSGIGGMFIDQTWDQLVSHWKGMGSNQYLADVEVYRRNGQFRYAAVWRVGSGNGALYAAEWENFVKQWKELWGTQELIDIEVINTNGKLNFLGVWRQKPGPKRGAATIAGALFAGITWEQLVAQWKELGEHQYLAEVETYVSDGKRLFAGLWRVGEGNGALYLMTDWQKFEDTKQSLNDTQEMIDFEMFQNDDGRWNFLGVWRVSGKQAGPLHASSIDKKFRGMTANDFLERWDKLKQKNTLVDIAVAVPAIVLRGDTTCKYGDVDCNRCAVDVPKQFKTGFEKGFNGGSWSFSGDRKYPPDSYQPEDAFNPFDKGLAGKHIQGLVRTNDSTYPYAGSHSHKDVGSIFFVGVDKKGNHSLSHLHRSNVDHPSGVAVLGDGLYVAEGDYLRSFGVFSSSDNQNIRYLIPKNDKRQKGLQGAGGGLGLAKLEDGSYLLVVTARGDGFRLWTIDGVKDNVEPRYTRFYRIVGSHAGRPEKMKDGKLNVMFIGEWQHEGHTKYPKTPMAYSENLSVVTECGTGHLYTIHTTGQWGNNGDGYWRLSRVETGAEGGNPRLKHIAIAKQSQDSGDCHHRSSATVHVNKSGQLEFLCSERKVTKVNPTGRFNFKEGKR